MIPNIDLIQEFVVTGHDVKAEFGGATGGVVNMVSKPGGNAFHGSAFEYVRNNFFDARDTFKDAKKTGPAAFRQNQFGAVITGPIIKNKTFFSGGYDGWRFSQPSPGIIERAHSRGNRRRLFEHNRCKRTQPVQSIFDSRSGQRFRTRPVPLRCVGKSAAGERAKAAGTDRRAV